MLQLLSHPARTLSNFSSLSVTLSRTPLYRQCCPYFRYFPRNGFLERPGSSFSWLFKLTSFFKKQCVHLSLHRVSTHFPICTTEVLPSKRCTRDAPMQALLFLSCLLAVFVSWLSLSMVRSSIHAVVDTDVPQDPQLVAPEVETMISWQPGQLPLQGPPFWANPYPVPNEGGHIKARTFWFNSEQL